MWTLKVSLSRDFEVKMKTYYYVIIKKIIIHIAKTSKPHVLVIINVKLSYTLEQGQLPFFKCYLRFQSRTFCDNKWANFYSINFQFFLVYQIKNLPSFQFLKIYISFFSLLKFLRNCIIFLLIFLIVFQFSPQFLPI